MLKTSAVITGLFTNTIIGSEQQSRYRLTAPVVGWIVKLLDWIVTFLLEYQLKLVLEKIGLQSVFNRCLDMKNSRFISPARIFCGVLLLSLMFHQPIAAKNGKKDASTKPLPEIAFEKLVYELGTVGPGSTNICEFKFTNAGKAVLKIDRVTADCSCTVPELSKKQYAPGESGSIKVQYKSREQPGEVARFVYVYSNDKSRPRLQLTIKAKIVLRVSCEPAWFDVYPGRQNASCPPLVLTSLDGMGFSVRSFKSIPYGITADFNPSVKATRFVLKPKVDASELALNSSGRIEIGLSHPMARTVVVNFNVLSKFKVSPPAIIIRDALPEKPVARDLWVFSSLVDNFKIDSAYSQKGVIKVLKQELKNNRYKFKLEITPPARKSRDTLFTDSFIVNIKNDEKLKIPCRGFYKDR